MIHTLLSSFIVRAFIFQSVEIGKSGHLRNLEPERPKLIKAHPKRLKWFVKASWDAFCFKFKGSVYEVARAFIESFDGKSAQIGDLNLKVTEELMAATIGFPMYGERGFKN